MANRILRDWTQSENIDSISDKSEVFFTRLIMKADDFGYYYGNPKILKSHLYPLKNISENDISNSINECVKSGLILLYSVSGKEYLHIINFGQRLRIMNSKFPKHTDKQSIIQIDSSPPTIDSSPPLEVEDEVETEDEVEDEINKENEIFENLKVEFLESDVWISDVSRNYKVSVDYVLEKMIDFIEEIKLKDDFYKGLQKVREHFINWLKIQIEKGKRTDNKTRMVTFTTPFGRTTAPKTAEEIESMRKNEHYTIVKIA